MRSALNFARSECHQLTQNQGAQHLKKLGHLKTLDIRHLPYANQRVRNIDLLRNKRMLQDLAEEVLSPSIRRDIPALNLVVLGAMRGGSRLFQVAWGSVG